MKRLAALLICLILLVPSLAQDAPPVITPDNAAALTLLESAGSALPTGVQFSPDGRYILAVTTDRTLVYSAEDLDAEPQIFPYNEFTFDDDGYLVIGGERWNLDTGQSIGIAPSIRVIRQNGNDPAVIEIQRPTGGPIVVQTIITEPITRLAVDDAYRVLAVTIDGNYRRDVTTMTYIYGLPQGNLIAAIPEPNDFPITRLYFTGAGGHGNLYIESAANFETTQGYVAMIDIPSGRLNDFYSGKIWNGIRFSPDGRFAYALEDKIIHSAGYEEYERHGLFGTPQFFAVTDSGIAAVFDDDVLRLARFQSDGGLSDFEAVPLGSDGPHRLSTAGSYVVLNDDGVVRAWNLRSGSLQPIEIALDPSVANSRDVQMSPDLERYRYWEDGRMVVRDTDTNEVLTDLPVSAAFAPDWSRAAYWDGALLTVDDFAAEQDYLHDANPGHLGEVADVQNGYAAFIGETLQVVDLDPADGHTDTVTIEGSFDGAQFFNRGACIVTFAPAKDAMSHTMGHRLNDAADCDSQTYLTPATGLTASVTTDGRYLADLDLYCNDGWGYGVPATNIFPLNGQPAGELPVILSIPFACGRQTFAFTADNESIYFVGDTLGYMTLDATGAVPVDVESADVILSYEDRLNHTFARAAGVVLSPDEQTIAVYVEDSKGLEEVQERYIEVFALDDLGPGTLRRDVRPLETIPDATVAYFSPNSNYVVTDKGLYSVPFANQTPAVNGTISAFSPDSQTLATYQDGFVTLWRVPQSQPTDLPLAQYDIGGVRELSFSADGTRLFVVRAGEVQTWGVTR